MELQVIRMLVCLVTDFRLRRQRASRARVMAVTVAR
jgi:predicted Co/Zn/Cd cation transporter (cation efflux family)